jgi:hypothetical protein
MGERHSACACLVNELRGSGFLRLLILLKGVPDPGGLSSLSLVLQRVASILACPQGDVTSANQTNPSSRPQMCIMRDGSCSLKPAVCLHTLFFALAFALLRSFAANSLQVLIPPKVLKLLICL